MTAVDIRFEPLRDNSRMVGHPSLTGLGKVCPSYAQNRWRALMDCHFCTDHRRTVGGRFPATAGYCSFAYSALACFKTGMSRSASFQRVRKSL